MPQERHGHATAGRETSAPVSGANLSVIMQPSRFAGFVLLAIALAVGCKPASDAGTGTGPATPPEGPIAKVRAYADGTVALDGHTISMDDLRESLAKHKSRKGVVWYYRENNKRGEPHPNALQALQIIVEARLPISMSDKEDFSTVISPDGQSRPRE